MVNAKLSTAILLAGKKKWKQSFEIFERILANREEIPTPGIEAIVKSCYGWALFKRRHLLKARSQLKEAQKFYKDMAAKFAQVNVQSSIIVPAQIETERAFEARLDIVNVSRAKGSLVRIENISFPIITVKSASPEYICERGTIEFKDKTLEPLSVTTLKLIMTAKKSGIVSITPKIIYKDESGKTRITQVKQLKINAVSIIEQKKSDLKKEDLQIDFKSINAQIAFNFLVDSFNEDYLNRRMPQERSGWRTFMDIVREGKVPKYSIYGSTGGYGSAIKELEQLGIVEIRSFAGERGRGGEVLKIKIAYNND